MFSTHDAVQKYLAGGFVVFPVPRGSKAPFITNWQDPDRRWTTSDFGSQDNIALRLDDIVDVDPDCPKARQACRYLLPQTTAKYGRLSAPGTPTHYLFRVIGDLGSHAFTDGKEMLIEIRTGSGHQSICPPSFIHAEPEKGKPADTLEWMPRYEPLSQIRAEDLLARVRTVATVALLARHWPANGPLTNQHSTAGMVAGLLCRILPKETGWDDRIVEIVKIVATIAGDDDVKDRERFARDTVAKLKAGEPVSGGPSLKRELGEDVVRRLYDWWGYGKDLQAIEDLNEQHAVLFGQHGKIVVLTETVENEQPQLRFSSPETMALLYPQQIVVGQTSRKVDRYRALGSWWTTHPSRRFYRGIELAPHGSNNKGYYNLWRGFAVEPKRGDWTLYAEHLLLVAGQNGDCVQYILTWMAETVQHPERPIGIALAFRGEQGTGKSTAAKWFGALFGPHFIHLDSEERLLGKFNAHLHNKIVVLADEAVWAGSKAGLGALKRMITEETLNVEKKNVDVIEVKNLLHMIVASNEEWVVPAGFDNRRFAVFGTSTKRQNDAGFFAAVQKQLFADGGLSALLYALLEHKVDIDLRVIPETEDLTEQKKQSMKPIERFWFEKLMKGSLFAVTEEEWPGQAEKSRVHDEYIQFLDKHHRADRSRRSTETELWMLLKKVTPSLDQRRGLLPSFVDREDHAEIASRVWLVPPLDECRRYWVEVCHWPADFTWEG